MKKINKFSTFIIVITFIASIIAMVILPNSFQFRFNLASGFHSAQKWELFVIPVCSILIYFLFKYIEKFYDKKNDLMRVKISNWMLYILPVIVFLVNINFIFEAYSSSNGVKQVALITGNTVYVINSILLIILGLALFIFVNQKAIKNMSMILSTFGIIGLFLSLLMDTEIISIAYFVLIIVLVISIIIYKIKFMKKNAYEQ